MEELISYLNDAGCGADLIAEICRLCESGDSGMMVQKLRRHRCTLMDELHESQRKVDCLDFLLWKLSKSNIQTI